MNEPLWSNERIRIELDKADQFADVCQVVCDMRNEYEQRLANLTAILVNTQAQRDTAYKERAAMRDEYLKLANRATALEIENHLLKQQWPQRAAALEQAMSNETCFDLAMTGATQ